MVRPSPVPRAPLSARELHIARMIAAGASDRDVATATMPADELLALLRATAL